MSPMVQNKRPQRPTILSIYRPIEEYWSSFGLAKSFGPDPERVLDPFDALLMHLVLDMAPNRPVLVDLAAEATGGASSVAGLTHPHVRRVVAVTGAGGESAQAGRVISALREFGRGPATGLAPLDVVPANDLPALLPDLPQAVILVHPGGGGPAELAESIRLWLYEQPDALVLFLGLGRVGECPAIEALIRLCANDSGRQLWLLRELGEVLAASRLGMVARHDHPYVADILVRIQGLYTGNYKFLDLLKAVNLAEVRAAQIDLEVLKSHPSSAALMAEPPEPQWTVQEKVEQVSVPACMTLPMPDTFHARVRRKLAPGVVGKSWRLSKRVVTRVRHKLAPGVVGKSWRLSKRVFRKSTTLIR